MKRLAIAASVLACATLPASAIETWQGDLFVTAATAACNGPGTPGLTVNDFFRAVFRPRNLEDNGVDTRLALFSTRNAHRVLITNAPLSGAGNYNGVFIGGTGGFTSYAGTFASASTTPLAPTVNTATVVLRVQLRNFGDTAGCNINLQGSLGNRPNL